MNLNLMAVGKNMPSWVTEGFLEYKKRLPHPFQLNLIELSAGKRLKNISIPKIIAKEGQMMLDLIPKEAHVIALDVLGKAWDTKKLAHNLKSWQEENQTIFFLVGGPDGLAPACLSRANQTWSLSNLTLPHALVRIVLVEQIYRAWSILHNHPYHR